MSHKKDQFSDASSFSLPETALDGVRYASLEALGALWRLGSLSPHWREELLPLGGAPTPEALCGLAGKDIFLHSGARPKIAVMCCGLGSVWPGMGRELYDNFPAARAAMDSLASYADWDLLSVMDETDPERLNHSRIQIPYLFMLEYAQWSQLVSLGFAPDLIYGHSLGELIALCLSGVYSPEAAWHLFEIRSQHMTSLENDQENPSGMLAISANNDVIQDALKEYPALSISNRNTPHQYILGGPRHLLVELRKNLRRKRIPAFLLGINLAFHNPAMRILRSMSLRRLNGLEMRPPSIPMLSCITAAPYPETQAEICNYIADLDENTVDWPQSVNAIRSKYGIQHFLELGPQETLCGLVNEIYPEAKCLPASRKGQELQAMRQLCAQLYSLGLLHDRDIAKRARLKTTEAPAESAIPHASPLGAVQNNSAQGSPEWKIVMEILSEETGRPVRELYPELDLRYDLALRSSRFPYLVQEAERRLNRQIALERLLQISTVGDLANFLTGAPLPPADMDAGQKAALPLPVDRPSPFLLPPLTAYKISANKKKSLDVWRPNPDAPQLLFSLSGPIALCVLDDELLPQIWLGMAPFPTSLLIPSRLLPKCSLLEKSGNKLFPLEIDSNSDPEAVAEAIAVARADSGALKGLLFIPPPLPEQASPLQERARQNFLAILPKIMTANPDAWLCCLQRQIHAGDEDISEESVIEKAGVFFALLNSFFPGNAYLMHAIYWLDQRPLPSLQNRIEAGDMLARELLYKAPRETLWLSAPCKPSSSQSPEYCPSAICMDFMEQTAPLEQQARFASFTGVRQFSTFANPSLLSHGSLSTAELLDIEGGKAPWLPLGYALEAMLAASRLVCPWLMPYALSDVWLESLPLLPYGITRECRLEADGRQWMLQEKRLARICRTSMAIRGLSRNGRRTQSWDPLCSALCILGRSNDNMAPYNVPHLPDMEYAPIPSSCLDAFYKSLNFCDEWRILKDLAIHKESSGKNASFSWRADLHEMPELIARSSEWEYHAFAYLMEAVCQALWLALPASDPDPRAGEGISGQLAKWRCARIGWIRFVDSLGQYGGDLSLTFKRSWTNSRFTRFDGRIDTAEGKTILSFLNFEFDGIE